MISCITIGFLLKTKNAYKLRFMSHKVFVYGTLKRNEPNHYWLMDENNGVSRFVGDATTTVKYPLIIATRYNIPFLLYAPGTGYFVKGEVYEVDEKMLSKLDILEDHPNYYIREIDDIKLFNKSTKQVEIVKCWIYFLKNFKPHLLNLPMMENYSSTGDHGKPYLDRSKRDPKYQFELKDIKL